MNDRLRRQGVDYLVAIAVTAAMVALRWLLDPVMGDTLPLVTLFGGVAIVVWFGGYRPALVSVALGYLACAYLFVSPRGTFGNLDSQNLIGLLAYAVTCGFIVGLGEAMRIAQRRSAENEERLRTTFASIGDGAIATDMDGLVTRMNPVAEALTGWTIADALGKPLGEVFHIVNELTRQPVENPAARALADGVVIGLANHTVLIAKDGIERPIDDSAAPIHCKDGLLVGCVLVFRDISERRRLEKKIADQLAAARFLAAIIESSSDAIVSKSLDGIIQSWNRGAESVFGYTAEQAVGKPITLIIPEDMRDEERMILNRIRAGECVDHYETTRVRNDGRRIQVSLTVSPIKDDEGRIIGASKIARDITERKLVEERVFGLMAELKEADKRKDEFLATLAHELRNPLAPIRNAVQILMQKGSADLNRIREVIDRQVKHMARLLEDLLDVSRISHDKLVLRKEQIELSETIRIAVETSQPLIERGQHTLDVSLPTTPVYLDADPVRLAQVFSNLLNNAAKYTEPGGKIQISAECQDDEVVVSVKDNGLGLAPETRSRIFTMFSQADRALERSQGGLGIGLALVRGLVELHGGKIEARSDGLGKGSEFIVRLPILRASRVAGSARHVESGHSGPRKRRFLIVDDLEDSADSLALLLREWGNEVSTAYNGEEAVALTARFRPDVILMDLGMPILNGYEACRRIRELPEGKEIVLIALTGWGRDEDRRQTEQAGFDFHLVKPVDPAALMALLEQLPTN